MQISQRTPREIEEKALWAARKPHFSWKEFLDELRSGNIYKFRLYAYSVTLNGVLLGETTDYTIDNSGRPMLNFPIIKGDYVSVEYSTNTGKRIRNVTNT